jgi:hypothetical protein
MRAMAVPCKEESKAFDGEIGEPREHDTYEEPEVTRPRAFAAKSTPPSNENP